MEESALNIVDSTDKPRRKLRPSPELRRAIYDLWCLAREEAFREAAVRKAALCKAALRRAALRKEALRREALRKEALRKEALRDVPQNSNIAKSHAASSGRNHLMGSQISQ